MRFAIKTRPEHQTWAQLRDVWVAADEVELFESVWNKPAGTGLRPDGITHIS